VILDAQKNETDQRKGTLELIRTKLPEVVLIKPRVFGDSRGLFYETYHKEKLEKLGIADNFVQDNYSRSVRGTLRGLHYQLNHPQAKLCRVVNGEVLDVAVDIRRGSPTFGQWVSAVLSAENKLAILVPGGFAHGFAVLSETTDFLYKCSDFYYPEDECGVAWNDPELKIDWKITSPLLSEKDKRFLSLANMPAEKLPAYRSSK
jgi:dTDP-4-dehydrorhamnose 3,5-epimerase